jgi:hypothetical protein
VHRRPILVASLALVLLLGAGTVFAFMRSGVDVMTVLSLLVFVLLASALLGILRDDDGGEGPKY